jgi:hypothetical protein
MVINDEGHHVHDEESEWMSVIRRLHADSDEGLAGQLDFSATPRYPKGGLFTWTVYDYPLKQAIIDNVVKQPMKGITRGEGSAVRHRERAVSGVPDCGRRTLARVPHAARATRQEADLVRNAQQHR